MLFEERLSFLNDSQDLKDSKSKLQEYLQKKGEALPLYTIMKEETNNQIKKFNIMCSLEDLNLSIEAEGNTRKKAEIKAAEKMLELIERKND